MKLREIMSLIEEYGNRKEDIGYIVSKSAVTYNDPNQLELYRHAYLESIKLLQEIREEIKNYDG